ATLLPSGKVLVAGGQQSPAPPCGRCSSVTTATAELYDPATGLWSATGSMSSGGQYQAAVLTPAGKVLVVDGVAQQYDPATGAWSALGNLDRTRLNPTATLLASSKVLVAGGGSAALGDPGS